MTDRASTPVWMKVLGLALLLSYAGVAAALLSDQDSDGTLALSVLLPGCLVAALGVVLSVGAVSVTVRDEVVICFRPVFRRLIPFADIETVRTVEQSWFDFGGTGLRWRVGRTGLILGNRPALSVTTTAGHEYVVQCSDPEGTAEVIRDRLSARGAQDS
jgi:hypothetical protein